MMVLEGPQPDAEDLADKATDNVAELSPTQARNDGGAAHATRLGGGGSGGMDAAGDTPGYSVCNIAPY